MGFWTDLWDSFTGAPEPARKPARASSPQPLDASTIFPRTSLSISPPTPPPPPPPPPPKPSIDDFAMEEALARVFRDVAVVQPATTPVLVTVVHPKATPPTFVTVIVPEIGKPKVIRPKEVKPKVLAKMVKVIATRKTVAVKGHKRDQLKTENVHVKAHNVKAHRRDQIKTENVDVHSYRRSRPK